jgi:two-component sensor histidine kinase
MVKVWWRRISYRRTELRWFGATGFALVCVAVATVARVLLGLIGSTLTFATFFPAVLVAALFGGRISGFLSIPFSIAAVWWAFIPPAFAFGKITAVDAANFIMFSLSSLLVVVLALAHRRIVFDLEDEERSRDLLVNELEHRSKNMLAVIASLVHQTVQNGDEADTLIARMKVAADNRDLLDEPSGRDMALRDILAATVQEPYGVKRIALSGPDLTLNGFQARSLRIVFHELTTNAVKYGALSQPKGKIRIDWTRADDMLTIVWAETDGPKVSPPSRYNFGSKLITNTLKQMDAQFTPTFAETGYRYRIELKVGSAG